MSKAFYQYRVVQYNDSLVLNVNFSKDGPTVTGNLSPSRPYVFLDFQGEIPTLMFANKITSFKVKMTKSVDEATLEQMREMGRQVASIIGFFGRILNFALGASVFIGGGGAVIKVMRLFKVVYR